MFDPYAIRIGTEIDCNGLDKAQLEDAKLKLLRRGLTIRGGIVRAITNIEESRTTAFGYLHVLNVLELQTKNETDDEHP